MVIRIFFILSILMSAVLRAEDVLSTTDSWQDKLDGVDSTAVKRALESFTRSVKRLDTEYSKGFDNVRNDFALKLQKARETATKKGDLDTAGRIDDAIRSLGAVSGHPAQGKTSPFTQYSGIWTGTWGTTGNPVLILIDDSGNVSNADGPIKPMRGQYLFSTNNQPLVLVPMEDKIIALTWLTGKTPLRDQPRHAAILSPRKEKITEP